MVANNEMLSSKLCDKKIKDKTMLSSHITDQPYVRFYIYANNINTRCKKIKNEMLSSPSKSFIPRKILHLYYYTSTLCKINNTRWLSANMNIV